MLGGLRHDPTVGEEGEDGLLGDRGGVFNVTSSTPRAASTTLKAVSQESQRAPAGRLLRSPRRLLHDTDANEWVEDRPTRRWPTWLADVWPGPTSPAAPGNEQEPRRVER